MMMSFTPAVRLLVWSLASIVIALRLSSLKVVEFTKMFVQVVVR
jgi:hypothetical protein